MPEQSVDYTLQRDRLLDLIEYVEATERDRLKVELDLRNHPGFRAEAEIASLPGVSLDCGTEDDPVWLRVERLAKTPPPAPADPELALWVSFRDDVNSTPTLKTNYGDRCKNPQIVSSTPPRVYAPFTVTPGLAQLPGKRGPKPRGN